MKVALFVEGSHSPPAPRQRWPLERIWKEHLPGLAGCASFCVVHHISKVNLEQLAPGSIRASGNGDAVDQIIARFLREGEDFEAAVVAWDLEPPLHSEPKIEPARCRWCETNWIAALLAERRELPDDWRKMARKRSADYTGRDTPSARSLPARLRRFEIRLLCMEPEFEGLLLREGDVRRALGVAGRRVQRWPKDWSASPKRRGKDILDTAIEAARGTAPATFPPVRGNFADTATNEWAEWILRHFRENPAVATELRHHAIVRRLRELMPPPA